MTLKATFLFSQSTGQATAIRAAGFSETWYYPDDWATIAPKLSNFARRRAGFASRNTSIIGCRVQEIGGRSQMFTEVRELGQLASGGDIPNMALQAVCVGTVGQYKKYFQLRGIPDSLVEFGEFTPTQAFSAAWTQWKTAMQGQGAQFQCINATNPRVSILSIAADGTFITAAGTAFAVNGKVILRRTKNTINENVSGTYYIETRTDDTHGKIRNWASGTVNSNGTLAVYSFTYVTFADVDATRFLAPTTRKVGRPFFGFRGRQRRSRTHRA